MGQTLKITALYKISVSGPADAGLKKFAITVSRSTATWRKCAALQQMTGLTNCITPSDIRKEQLGTYYGIKSDVEFVYGARGIRKSSFIPMLEVVVSSIFKFP